MHQTGSADTGPAYSNNETFERRQYVHHSSSSADLDVAGRAAHLAIQPVLGILPERRSGNRRRSRPCIASGRTSMTLDLVVDVCQSQKTVACPNGGNWLQPTTYFSLQVNHEYEYDVS